MWFEKKKGGGNLKGKNFLGRTLDINALERQGGAEKAPFLQLRGEVGIADTW